jgi:hypothetical protein
VQGSLRDALSLISGYSATIEFLHRRISSEGGDSKNKR